MEDCFVVYNEETKHDTIPTVILSAVVIGIGLSIGMKIGDSIVSKSTSIIKNIKK